MMRLLSRFPRPLGIAVMLACGLSVQALGADATYRVVARTGQFAPGGGFFSSFGAPVISANGRVAFPGSVIGVLNHRGVWSEGVTGMNNLASVIRRNDPIPGVNGTFVGSLEFPPCIMNRTGELAFIVPITGAQAAFGQWALLKHDANGVHTVAAPGKLVSLPCGGLGCQRWITGIATGTYAFNATSQVAFAAGLDGTAVNPDNNEVVLLSDGVTTDVVMRKGDVAPTTASSLFTTFAISLLQLNDNGVVLTRNFLNDPNSNTAVWSAWRGHPGAMSLVARQGDPTPLGEPFGGGFLSFGEMAINNAGQTLFLQDAVNNLGDARRGLWRNAGGATQTMCLQGMPSPTGFNYLRPEGARASINPDGVMAYTATIQGPGINLANDTVIVRRLSNGVESLVVREGDQAPGLPNGVVFFNPGFTGQMILDDRRVIFRSLLSGPGIHEGNRDTLWISRNGAPPALLIRTGQMMAVDGPIKTVQDFTVALSAGSESGTRSGVSQLGQVALRVVFTDDTEAIIVASAVSACPGDVNGDGVVDFLDLNAVLSGFGHIGDVVDADLDLDGDVDFMDLNAVLSHYGVQCEL